MPCTKKVYKKQNRRRYSGHQPGPESGCRPVHDWAQQSPTGNTDIGHKEMRREARSASGQSAPGAPSKTRGTRAGRADARSVRARRGCRHAGRASTRGVRARGALRYAERAGARCSRPSVRFFSSRSGAPKSSRVGAAVAARPASVRRSTGRPPRPQGLTPST